MKMTETQIKEAEKAIAGLQTEQKELVLQKFYENEAWLMGCWMREEASKNQFAVGMSISLNRKKLFHVTMPNTAPLSDDWLRRKENTVYKFYKSSYEMAYFLDKNEQTVHSRYGLAHEDFAIAGGGVPITVEGIGVVGAVAVTGLPQIKDHGLAVDGIKYLLSLQK